MAFEAHVKSIQVSKTFEKSSLIKDAFISWQNRIMVPLGKMGFATELMLSFLIRDLVEKHTGTMVSAWVSVWVSVLLSASEPRPFRVLQLYL